MKTRFKFVLALLLVISIASYAIADQLMHFPTGTSRITWRDGSVSTSDANGNVTVASKNIVDAYSAGFTLPTVVSAMSTSITGTQSITAAELSAQYNVLYQNGLTTASTLTTPTAAQLGVVQQGNSSFTLQILNGNTSSGVITLVGGTGVTISGTATTAISGYHEYVATMATGTTYWTLTSAGTGTGLTGM